MIAVRSSASRIVGVICTLPESSRSVHKEYASRRPSFCDYSVSNPPTSVETQPSSAPGAGSSSTWA